MFGVSGGGKLLVAYVKTCQVARRVSDFIRHLAKQRCRTGTFAFQIVVSLQVEPATQPHPVTYPTPRHRHPALTTHNIPSVKFINKHPKHHSRLHIRLPNQAFMLLVSSGVKFVPRTMHEIFFQLITMVSLYPVDNTTHPFTAMRSPQTVHAQIVSRYCRASSANYSCRAQPIYVVRASHRCTTWMMWSPCSAVDPDLHETRYKDRVRTLFLDLVSSSI